MCVYVSLDLYGDTLRGGKEVSNPPGARVTESCDHPNVGSENQILILYTSREHL